MYGVSGLFYPETFSHGMNERIPVKAFYQGLEFMYRLVKGDQRRRERRSGYDWNADHADFTDQHGLSQC